MVILNTYSMVYSNKTNKKHSPKPSVMLITQYKYIFLYSGGGEQNMVKTQKWLQNYKLNRPDFPLSIPIVGLYTNTRGQS